MTSTIKVCPSLYFVHPMMHLTNIIRGRIIIVFNALNFSEIKDLEQRILRPGTQEDQPNIEQPINAEIPREIPTAPILDEELVMPNDNFPYNPNWPPVSNNLMPQTTGIACAGYQQSNSHSPPPYSEYGSSDAVIIDRQTSQAYFIRPIYRGRLPPINS